MTRIQILNLPADGQPFAVVIDQINWTNATASFTGQLNGVAEQVGARGILAFEDAVEIVEHDSPTPTPTSAPAAEAEAEAAKATICQFCERDCNGSFQSQGGGVYTCLRCLDWQSKIRRERDNWEKAANRNGELYSACENQRDDARQGLTELRARMSALADKLDNPAPDLLGIGPTRIFAANLIRAILDGASS